MPMLNFDGSIQLFISEGDIQLIAFDCETDTSSTVKMNAYEARKLIDALQKIADKYDEMEDE